MTLKVSFTLSLEGTTDIFSSVSGAGVMHDAASTPYLTLLKASEEVTFHPDLLGKKGGKKDKEKEIHGAPQRPR